MTPPINDPRRSKKGNLFLSSRRTKRKFYAHLKKNKVSATTSNNTNSSLDKENVNNSTGKIVKNKPTIVNFTGKSSSCYSRCLKILKSADNVFHIDYERVNVSDGALDLEHFEIISNKNNFDIARVGSERLINCDNSVITEDMENIQNAVDEDVHPQKNNEIYLEQNPLLLNFHNDNETNHTDNISTEITLQGKRIVDIQHFFEALKLAGNHAPQFGCTLNNMKIIEERRNGFASLLKIKCNMCHFIANAETVCDPVELNDNSVLGIMSIGSGYTHLQQFTATLDIPAMSQSTYNRIHEKLCDAWESSALEEMMVAAQEEKKLAFEAGDVTEHNIPYITVVCDGVWAKRSYRCNYNSLSGAAAIVGYRTKKVLYLGVRNKFCIICKHAENKKENAIPHKCYKNWNGSSSAMESDIICEGFKRSLSMYGLIYAKMLADGDSSCYKKILDCNPYHTQLISVKKIECRNHLLRNYINKIRDLQKDTSAGPLVLRKELKKNLLRFRWAITKAIEYRSSETCSLNEKVKNLKTDILNGPSHILGEHKNCLKSSYFCKKEYITTNTIYADIKLTALYDKLMSYVRYLANHAESLIHNMDNNPVEQFNSVIAKYNGGKRFNYCMRRSFQGRCFASVVSYNTKQPIASVVKKIAGAKSPGFYTEKLEQLKKNREMKRNKSKTKSKIYNTNRNYKDQDYGPHSAKPDLSNIQLEETKNNFLKDLQKTVEERQKIEEMTREQNLSNLWVLERRKRVTASKFGEICKKMIHSSRKTLVKSMIYPKTFYSTSINHGILHEKDALAALGKHLNKDIKKCGLYIDEKYPFLAATPDGVTGQDCVVEVKCPYSARDITPEDGIMQRKITFWTKDGKVNKNHDYYFQIQGQLHITKKKTCYFCVWTFKGIKVEVIAKDDDFWSNKMEQKLKDFYIDCILPELVDSRISRGLEIRDPTYVVKAYEEKQKLVLSKKK